MMRYYALLDVSIRKNEGEEGPEELSSASLIMGGHVGMIGEDEQAVSRLLC
jgi:hypothetical protein